MKLPLRYAGKTIYVEPYNTQIERELILFTEISDVPDIEGVFDILKNNISGDVANLSHQERLAVLYKLRSLSIGEEIGVKFQCNECKAPNESSLNISENIVPGEGTYKIKDQFKEVTEDNLQEFIDENVDELELDDFDRILEEVKKSVTKFSFVKECKCIRCQTVHYFDVSDDDYIIKSLSDDTVISMYQTIADLVFFGDYTKQDIDSMIPFERTLFVGILNKTREELNK